MPHNSIVTLNICSSVYNPC